MKFLSLSIIGPCLMRLAVIVVTKLLSGIAEAEMKYLGAALLGVPTFLIIIWFIANHL